MLSLSKLAAMAVAEPSDYLINDIDGTCCIDHWDAGVNSY